MRSFEDNQGKQWQAALLDASYGNIMLIFSPMHGGEIRQQLLGAENLAAAEAQMVGMDDDALRTMLAEADVWDPAAG